MEDEAGVGMRGFARWIFVRRYSSNEFTSFSYVEVMLHVGPRQFTLTVTSPFRELRLEQIVTNHDLRYSPAVN